MTKSIPAILRNAVASFDDEPVDAELHFGDALKELRKRLGLSQEEFADKFGISVRNLQNWEQSSRGTRPDSSALHLLEMIAADPDGVARIVRQVKEVRREIPLTKGQAFRIIKGTRPR
jgi:putative transcriptional regulator